MHKAQTKICKASIKNKHIREIFANGKQSVKIALIQNVSELMQVLIKSVMQDEVEEKTGKRYKHDKKQRGVYRWGTNPGSVRIGQEKVEMEVPRLRDNNTKREVALESYEELKSATPDEDQLLKGVLHGISMTDYHGVVGHFANSYGLSKSKVSEIFKEESAKRVEEFITRDLSTEEYIGLFIDGKYLAKEQIVIVLGITEGGDKRALGFVQTASENSRSIKGLLTNLIERGLKYEAGLLCVIDGSTGIHRAVEETFGEYAVIKRCAWHKRENILSYLPENRKEEIRKRFDKAYGMSDYNEALNAFIDLTDDLKRVNISASRSAVEGLDELLMLHKMGIIEDFRKSFSTTNIIESLNSQLGRYIGKVKYWKNSDQRYRWVASSLIEIEPRFNKVMNHSKLPLLRERLKKEIEYKLNKKGGSLASNFN